MKLALAFLLLACLAAEAHVGSPNVFVEGKAGEYPIRVVIRPPDVAPGLAEINVRVDEPVRRVTVLPVFWKAGRAGSPLADEARLLRGETNLYSAQLWLMKSGAYSVDVSIDGPRGVGALVVPVNSMATNTRPMSWPYGAVLSLLAMVLFMGGLRIAGAVFGESQLEPGMLPSKKDRWRGRVAMVATTGVLSILLFGGKKWWDLEDRKSLSHALYVRPAMAAAVRNERDQLILTVKVDSASSRGRWTPLIADHGKLMHLFLIGDGEPRAFAHLHPAPRSNQEFEAALPPLPAGPYQVYADVTHEDGFAETLIARAEIPAASLASYRLWMASSGEPICSTVVPATLTTNNVIAADPDDSWFVERKSSSLPTKQTRPGRGQSANLTDGYRLIWENSEPMIEGQDVSLRFKLITGEGQPAWIDPYMGMLGHAVVRRQDGAVFAHIHPVGTFSMAAQAFFAHGKPPQGLNPETRPSLAQPASTAADPHAAHPIHGGAIGEISFPYAFPQPGPYRLWIQMKSRGRIWTAAFETTVSKAK